MIDHVAVGRLSVLCVAKLVAVGGRGGLLVLGSLMMLGSGRGGLMVKCSDVDVGVAPVRGVSERLLDLRLADPLRQEVGGHLEALDVLEHALALLDALLEDAVST